MLINTDYNINRPMSNPHKPIRSILDDNEIRMTSHIIQQSSIQIHFHAFVCILVIILLKSRY